MEDLTFDWLLTGTISVIASCGSEYTYCAAWPSGAAASWLAIAHSAENIGQARLVPPITCHCSSGCSPGIEMAITAPVTGSASHAISGTCRNFPGTPFWNEGFGNPPRQLPF